MREQIEMLLEEVEKLHKRNLLSESVGPDYFEPGMMEYLDKSEGVFNEESGDILIRFESKGTRYDGRTEQIEKVHVGDRITIVRDSDNPSNANNFLLLTENGHDVGNMPAELCNAIAPLYDQGGLEIISASVSFVEPISKRSRYAKQAMLFVEATAKLIDINHLEKQIQAVNPLAAKENESAEKNTMSVREASTESSKETEMVNTNDSFNTLEAKETASDTLVQEQNEEIKALQELLSKLRVKEETIGGSLNSAENIDSIIKQISNALSDTTVPELHEKPGAYKGTDEYVFISYSHRNQSIVEDIILQMQNDGYRVWYDEGIEPGTEWDENIAYRVEHCSYFIAMISKEYLKSDNCQDELNFARDEGKNILLVYLDDTKLPGGMRMRLNRLQAIFWHKLQQDAFFEKMYQTKDLDITRA